MRDINQPNQSNQPDPTNQSGSPNQEIPPEQSSPTGQPNRSSAMQIIYDDFYLYTGYFNHPAICHLRIYSARGSLPVVIATELENNIGVSITRQFAELATDVWRRRLLPQQTQARDGCLWIEHHPGRQPRATSQQKRGQEQPANDTDSATRATSSAETFDRVQFSFAQAADGTEQLGEPVRIPISRAEVEQIIGQPFTNPPRRYSSWTS